MIYSVDHTVTITVAVSSSTADTGVNTMKKSIPIIAAIIFSPTLHAGNDLGEFGTWLEDRTGIQDITKPLRQISQEIRVETVGPVLASYIYQSRNDALQASTNPIPDNIKAELRGFFPETLLNKVRYRNGQGNDLSPQANSFKLAGTYAITLGHVIVFKDQKHSSNNAEMWAHELAHVQQYDRWGITDFAKKYVRDHIEVEREADNMQRKYVAWKQSPNC